MEQRHLQSAQRLVQGAEVFATNSQFAFVGHYPTLSNISNDEWKLLLTIAGTGTAMLKLAEQFTPEEQRELTAEVLQGLQGWQTTAVDELKDFLDFVTSTVTEPDQLSDAIGTWVIRSINTVEPNPTAAHVLGLTLIKTFQNWWA